MPRLLLLRHAKSSWDDFSLEDFERPLNTRGRRTAPLIGRYIADNDMVPDRILCSASARTRETLALIQPEFQTERTALFLDDLYDGSEGTYTSLIRAHGGDAATLLVVGHNPATQMTALELIGDGAAPTMRAIDDKFPTAALVVIDFDVDDWDEISPKTGHLIEFIRPRELATEDGA